MNPQFDIMVTTACDARCPFCVQEATFKPDQVADEQFLTALRAHFADFYRHGGRRVVITGGEPLLVPRRVLAVLGILAQFPSLEVKALYSNGRHLLRSLGDKRRTIAQALRAAHLGCVNLSIHHHDDTMNGRIMGLAVETPTESIAAHLRRIALPFRLNLTLQRGGIASWDDLRRYIDWGFGVGASDIYVRELFDLNVRHTRTDTDRQAVTYARRHRVAVAPFVRALAAHPDFRFLGQERESLREKTEWAFLHLPAGRRVYLSSLSVGTESRDDMPYLVLMPDGQLYRGWLGADDQIARVNESDVTGGCCAVGPEEGRLWLKARGRSIALPSIT